MRHLTLAVIGLFLTSLAGCADLETLYLPVQTVALTGPLAQKGDTRCDAPVPKTAPPYYSAALRDCTSREDFLAFAFSGGGIRSAAFGYGALQAAHELYLPGEKARTLDQDIDIVTGVSGGSFTAAAFASQRQNLFPDGKPDYYRDHFLTHDFFSDLALLYLSPLHWRWLFPYYGTNDEMAKIYAEIPFSSKDDKLLAADFGVLAQKGKPFLIVQATDFGNEQPFTFTQNDFDLICSDVRKYPVGGAIAASSAFPILFSPIQLTNHHFPGGWGSRIWHAESAYCKSHRPAWIDQLMAGDPPTGISRVWARAKAAESYLRTKEQIAQTKTGQQKSQAPALRAPRQAPAPRGGRSVYLQDGGAADNVALRGMMNIFIQNLPHLGGTEDWDDQRLCKSEMQDWQKMGLIVVDGMAKPNRSVAELPYLSDLSLILDVTSSTMIDANSFETMLSVDATLRKVAARLSRLSCGGKPRHTVTPYFAHVSFDDLDGSRMLPGPACGKGKRGRCTVDDLAHSETSLNFSGAEVDALIDAGKSAFLCNGVIHQLLSDLKITAIPDAPLSCRVDWTARTGAKADTKVNFKTAP